MPRIAKKYSQNKTTSQASFISRQNDALGSNSVLPSHVLLTASSALLKHGRQKTQNMLGSRYTKSTHENLNNIMSPPDKRNATTSKYGLMLHQNSSSYSTRSPPHNNLLLSSKSQHHQNIIHLQSQSKDHQSLIKTLKYQQKKVENRQQNEAVRQEIKSLVQAIEVNRQRISGQRIGQSGTSVGALGRRESQKSKDYFNDDESDWTPGGR